MGIRVSIITCLSVSCYSSHMVCHSLSPVYHACFIPRCFAAFHPKITTTLPKQLNWIRPVLASLVLHCTRETWIPQLYAVFVPQVLLTGDEACSLGVVIIKYHLSWRTRVQACNSLCAPPCFPCVAVPQLRDMQQSSPSVKATVHVCVEGDHGAKRAQM